MAAKVVRRGDAGNALVVAGRPFTIPTGFAIVPGASLGKRE
jgi:hypothetical protein